MVVNRQGTKTAKENDTTNTQSTNTEMKLLVPTDLPPDLEHLVQETIGSCIAVHRELGPARVHISAIPVRYRGQVLCHQRLDVLIDSRLILEIKSVERILAIHVAQVISYLRVTGTRVALLVNFNVPILAQGIRRVVL